MWLEKGRTYHEADQSFAPLLKRRKSLKEYVESSQRKSKKKQKKKTKILPNIDVSFVGLPPPDPKNLSLIVDFLLLKKVNYGAYKPNYFLRRLQARMKRVNADTYQEYHTMLRTDSRELELLLDSFSINVTHFFRDKELFAQLEREIIPRIFSDKRGSIRIWSAGCAIGPEPYSIAILIDSIEQKKRIGKVFLLATDVNIDLLNQAKEGVFDKELLKETDPLKIAKYFTPVSANLFCLDSQIRKMVTFQQHDLRSPPPARNLDLILCRNVIIYFSRPQGEKLFRRFYSALKPNGYLILGKCEILPQSIRNKFEIINTQNRIYRRVN
ncbi:MAG: CheR family methyltransferase [Candidatus Thorarchaeota archaeon]